MNIFFVRFLKSRYKKLMDMMQRWKIISSASLVFVSNIRIDIVVNYQWNKRCFCFHDVMIIVIVILYNLAILSFNLFKMYPFQHRGPVEEAATIWKSIMSLGRWQKHQKQFVKSIFIYIMIWLLLDYTQLVLSYCQFIQHLPVGSCGMCTGRISLEWHFIV